MAAPCFYTQESLASDLAALGFDKAHHPQATCPTGELRLETLAWLANVINPGFESCAEDDVADFWDALGLHCTQKKADGHRFPVVISVDRQRERNAASYYMRVAIDLTMAFQRRRQGDSRLELDNLLEYAEREQKIPVWTEDDGRADDQLTQLMKNRHTLFPSTVRLLEQTHVKKRRPLAQRKGTQNNGASTAIASQFKSKSPRKTNAVHQDKVNTREEILDRLRTMQRDTQDLRLRNEHNDDASSSVERVEEQEIAELTDDTLKTFGADCARLSTVLAKFNEASSSALAIRARQTDLAYRDASSEEELSAAAIESDSVADQVQNALSAIAQVQEAVSKLEHGRRLLESLPNSYTMREIVEHKRRLEGQMI